MPAITIEFDAKSYQRDASITIPGHGTYECGNTLHDSEEALEDPLTRPQFEALEQIQRYGLRLRLDLNGSFTVLGTHSCDKGHQTTSEVRRLPAGGGAVILCESCWRWEMRYRRDRNKDLHSADKFETPDWRELEIYDGS